MSLIKINSLFKASPHPYPSDDIHKSEKQKDWHLQYVKAFYNSYLGNKCGILENQKALMAENRAYCDGTQNPQKYKELLLDMSQDESLKPLEQQNTHWMNINFEDMVVVLPKFYRIFSGIFSSQQHEVMANAIDEFSMETKEKEKWRSYVMSKERALLQFVDNITGNQTQYPDQMPQDLDEMIMMEEMGSLKLKTEMMIEAALKDIDNRSNWEEIESQILKDVFENNIIAVRDYTNTMTGKVEVRRIDPLDLIYTLDENGEVAKAGIVKKYTVANLRKELIYSKNFDGDEGTFSEEHLKNIAITYGGILGNKELHSLTLDPLSSGAYEYDDFLVYVFDAEWASIDSTIKSHRTNKYGDTLIYEEIKNVKEKREKKLVKQNVKVFRTTKWVIGSDIIWDYGLAYDIPRPTESEARSSFTVKRIPGKSMVEANKLHADQIQLCHLRLQNAVALAPNAGLAYEYSSLQGMKLGSKGASPMDLIRMRNQQGSIVYKATVHRGGMISPNIGNPIFELEGGIGRLLDELLKIIQINLESIRENTGLNAVVDASTPQQDQGLGVSQMAMAATNNSLKPIYSTYISVRNRLAENCAQRVQLIAKYNGEYPGYFRVFGRTGWEILKITSDIAYVNYGMKIQALPNQKHIYDLENSSIEALRNQILTWGEYFAVKRMFMAGTSMKYIQAFIANREVKKMQEMSKAQQENMQMNAQVQQQSLEQSSAMEAQQEQLKSELKKAEKSHEVTELIRLKEAEAIIEQTYSMKSGSSK